MNFPKGLAASIIGATFGLAILAPPQRAHAAHETDIANSLKNPFGFNLSVGYGRSLRRGAIKRERSGLSSTAGDIKLFKELRFSQVRHILSVRGEAQIVPRFMDLMLHVEFPIVLSDVRELGLTQNGGDPCGTPRTQNCVTPRNSRLLNEGFLPASIASAIGPSQVNIAGDTRAPNMFYLPNRSGIDQMYLGLSWAPLNQRRDPTKPTWVLGFEARLAIGEAMTHNGFFDDNTAAGLAEGLLNPRGNTSVGRGLHQFRWWTSISKRYKYLDPWMTFYYMLPHARDGSLFEKTSFPLTGQQRSGPRQVGGVEVGVEIVPWERPDQNAKLSIELRAGLEGRFEGRGYSELWEVFANNPLLKGPCRPDAASLHPDRWQNGTYCPSPDSQIPFPGLTSIENHAVFNAALAINFDFTRYLRTRVGVSLGHEQQHFITAADAGIDVDNKQGITYTREDEVNPMYRPYIDQPGHRWRVAETTVFDFFVAIEGRI